ncbi:MAG: hypothetical protein JNK58_11345 [Phycisphaerae bacterium]|nr:hypothetical protein [Phycisphaerae bacterium]
MHLNLAEALKREVLGMARDRVARGTTRDHHTTSIAVGLAPSARGARDYRVAVRLPPAGSGRIKSLVTRLNKHAKDFDIAHGVRYRPRVVLRAGGSCGHPRATAGTLGGFVEDDEHYYLLSNSHVLAASNKARANDPIYQPGPADIRRKRFNIIARLARWTILRPGEAPIDAAIARLSDDTIEFHPRWTPGVGRLGRVPLDDRLALRHVVKRGRTTGVTRGAVSAFDLDGVEIDYSPNEDGSLVLTFHHQIEFAGTRRGTPFSKPGDSGAFILDAGSLRPAALLFAGGRGVDGIDRTLGHFMPDVLERMRVRLAR